jgi:hypothetical protein
MMMRMRDEDGGEMGMEVVGLVRGRFVCPLSFSFVAFDVSTFRPPREKHQHLSNLHLSISTQRSSDQADSVTTTNQSALFISPDSCRANRRPEVLPYESH